MQSVIMDENNIRRALMRISHEILEKNETGRDLCVIGIKSRGVALGSVICENLKSLGADVNFGTIDITHYRDDRTELSETRINNSEISFDINGKTVILVDDVLFTGRTTRAAIDAVLAVGRPKKIQLAVLVDRGHREFPIKADYTGKNVPTSHSEAVKVSIPPYDSETNVKIIHSKG